MLDSILIYSGGLDSTTMLYEYRESVACAVSFDYGSRHNESEIDCARFHCKELGIEHIVIPLDFMKDYFVSSLLKGQGEVPEGGYDISNMHSTVVPFRNGIMLSIVAGLAESRGMKRIMIANHSGDHAIYPDCSPDFIHSMHNAIASGTYEKISLFAPYTNISKVDIVRRGVEFGIDYSKTWSCYRGGERHCGVCATCLERKSAFRLLGITDHTLYEN